MWSFFWDCPQAHSYGTNHRTCLLQVAMSKILHLTTQAPQRQEETVCAYELDIKCHGPQSLWEWASHPLPPPTTPSFFSSEIMLPSQLIKLDSFSKSQVGSALTIRISDDDSMSSFDVQSISSIVSRWKETFSGTKDFLGLVLHPVVFLWIIHPSHLTPRPIRRQISDRKRSWKYGGVKWRTFYLIWQDLRTYPCHLIFAKSCCKMRSKPGLQGAEWEIWTWWYKIDPTLVRKNRTSTQIHGPEQTQGLILGPRAQENIGPRPTHEGHSTARPVDDSSWGIGSLSS